MLRSAWAVLLCAAAATACSSSAPSTLAAATEGSSSAVANTAPQPPACPAGSTCRLVGANGGATTPAAFVAQCGGRFPDYVDLVPPGYTGRRFVLSQDYPAAVPAVVTAPWLKIDFKTDAGVVQYMMALREYVYAGTIEADWQGEKNLVRKWYHVPWMTPGKRPREFVRGMTEERPLSGPELGIKKGHTVQNWAIGYYNNVGAVSIGAVFANPNAPDPAKAPSAVGTVVAKVLFSAATADDFEGVDILAGSPAWDANLIVKRTPFEKKIGSVRLLQMDVAARDPRATETGWVFGTFAYDRNAKGVNGWDQMMPVGLMWGSDPKRLPTTTAPPEQTRINAAAPPYALTHLGWGRRMNGPVDNPASACLSCHSTAQIPNVLTSLIPMRGCTDGQKLHWFRNLRGNQPFGAVSASCEPQQPAGVVALDYSLQLAVALNAMASGEFVNPCGAGPGPRGAPAPLAQGQKVYETSSGDNRRARAAAGVPRRLRPRHEGESMADIEHKDTYTIKNNAAMIGVRVRILGGHSGAWVVTIDDMPVAPQPDGFVSLGLGSLVRGREVVVTTLITKISAGKKFTVEHEVREVSAGGGLTTPLEVKGDFGAKNTSEVEETISFS